MDRSRSAIKDKIAKKEKKKDKKKKKKQLSTSESELNMSDNEVEAAAAAANGEAAGNDIPPEMLPAQNRLRQDSTELEEENERRKNREPAIVFKDLEVSEVTTESFEDCLLTFVPFPIGCCRFGESSSNGGWKTIKR